MDTSTLDLSYEALQKEAPALRERINRFRTSLAGYFVGKAAIIDLMTVCAVAQEPLLLVGPPGTAKSDLILKFRDALGIRAEETFEYMLTRFTEPSEVFGPIDIKQLREGRYLRRASGKLPTASMVFLDEIFKANSAILNALLTVINEKKFYQDGQPVPVRLKVLFAATNDLPEQAELAALKDRFCLKIACRSVQERHFVELVDAGLAAIGVSVDGTEEVHDTLRANPGSHAAAMAAIRNARAAGLIVTSNSQVNRLNMHQLPEIAAQLEEAGVRVWRCQLTAPMGRAADRPDWIVEPYMVLDIIDKLAEIQAGAKARAQAKGMSEMRHFRVTLGNNMGYYGPHEAELRSRPDRRDRFFTGCQAGKYVMGIESDGVIKGCPSLPTAPYVGGNVRDLSLEQIWADAEEIAFTRERGREELWGHCATCYYGEICKAGCSFTSHSTLGRRGNNPFCYYRADKLKKQGIREVLRLAQKAPGAPYDFGRFELFEEPWDSPDPKPTKHLKVL